MRLREAREARLRGGGGGGEALSYNQPSQPTTASQSANPLADRRRAAALSQFNNRKANRVESSVPKKQVRHGIRRLAAFSCGWRLSEASRRPAVASKQRRKCRETGTAPRRRLTRSERAVSARDSPRPGPLGRAIPPSPKTRPVCAAVNRVNRAKQKDFLMTPSATARAREEPVRRWPFATEAGKGTAKSRSNVRMSWWVGGAASPGDAFGAHAKTPRCLLLAVGCP